MEETMTPTPETFAHLLPFTVTQGGQATPVNDEFDAAYALYCAARWPNTFPMPDFDVEKCWDAINGVVWRAAQERVTDA